MVTFCLMARPAREQNPSFLLRWNINAHCPALIKAKSVYRAAILIVWLYYLTESIASCLALVPWGARVNKTLRGQCVTPCGGENNIRTHDWLSRTGMCMWRRLQPTLTGPRCVCTAIWKHVCAVNINILCPLRLISYSTPIPQVPNAATINRVDCIYIIETACNAIAITISKTILVEQ